jgi:hypothetical protein
MSKDKPKNKPATPSRTAEEACRQLDALARNLAGRRAMIEDIIRRNREAAHIPGVRLYGGTATEREAWFDWYDRDLLNARAVGALDPRLPGPPTAAETPRDSYRQLENWCREAHRTLGGSTFRRVKIRNVFIAIFLAAVVIGVFEIVIHFTTWPGTEWVRNHQRSLALHLAFAFLVLLSSLSIFVPAWRGWCLGIGVVGVLLVVLSFV